jgi:outer membrane biosynthesis protein TonB
MRHLTTARRLRRGTTGQGLVEYALILCLVAVLAIGGAFVAGSAVADALNTTANEMGDPGTTAASPAAGTPTPKATKTPKPTATPKPAATPKPTKTPKPTATPKPTKTPKP